MSTIISLFIFVYLAAIVLASILGVVWTISLLLEYAPLMKKVFFQALRSQSNSGLMRLISQ